MDAAGFAVLLACAIVVLIFRRRRTRTLLLANWPLLIYFLYCLASVVWSYHQDIALKRWIKSVGDLAMALVVVTDPHPVTAIRRMVSRIGMFLLPISVLFIRYFDDLGRGYTSDGLRMNTGVTDNKNALGLIVLVISLVVLWNVRSLLVHKNEPNRGRRLVAQGILLTLGLVLFQMANCSTCKACFALGALLIFALNMRVFKGRPARVHALCLTLLLVAVAALFGGGQAGVASALGRESSFSGRTDIWAAVIPAVPNAFIGAGFESFWISPNVQMFQQTLLSEGWYPPLVKDLNEAHNGYLEMYLNLGWIGVGLLALVLISGYRRACKAFQRSPEIGSLFIAYIVAAIVYGITEASFRMMNPSWIFLVLAVVGASGVAARLFGEESKVPGSRRGTTKKPDVLDKLDIERPAVRAIRPRFNAI
jgi:O-antigen ligase